MQEETKGEVVIYKAKDGKTFLDVKLEQETVWLNLNQMAELYARDKASISRHIRNVFKEGFSMPRMGKNGLVTMRWLS